MSAPVDLNCADCGRAAGLFAFNRFLCGRCYQARKSEHLALREES